MTRELAPGDDVSLTVEREPGLKRDEVKFVYSLSLPSSLHILRE